MQGPRGAALTCLLIREPMRLAPGYGEKLKMFKDVGSLPGFIIDDLRPLQNTPFRTISALRSDFNPRNI